MQCGKGTYIRALARDLGERLGCGAGADAAAQRVGPFDVGTALGLDTDAETARAALLPLSAAVAQMPRVTLPAPEAAALRRGQGVPLAKVPQGPDPLNDEQEVAVFDAADTLIAVAGVDLRRRLAVAAQGADMILKRCLLGFWAVWFAIVACTNLVDALNAWGVLDPKWKLASKNWGALQEATARYDLSWRWTMGLFLCVIVWEGLAAFLYAGACVLYRGGEPNAGRVAYPAFFVGLMLWAGFMIADEICLTYTLEATHMRLFIAQLATVLVVYLLPEERRLEADERPI